MDNFSGLTLALSLVGLVLLVVLLVSILYRPAKRLNVLCSFKPGSDEKQHSVLIVILENIGKRKLKLLPPYVRFSHATHSKRFLVKPETITSNFPRSLKIGEKLTCELDLSHFKSLLEKHTFHPTHVKFVINDSAGLDFESHSLTFKV
jgi:hypothetical protein